MRGDEIGAQKFNKEVQVNKKERGIMIMIVVTLSRTRFSNTCVVEPGTPGNST